MLEDTARLHLEALGCTPTQVEHHLKHLTAIAHSRAAKASKGTKQHRTSPPRNYGPRGKRIELTREHVTALKHELSTTPHRWSRPHPQDAYSQPWAGHALAQVIAPHKASINQLTSLLVELRELGVFKVQPKATNRAPGMVVVPAPPPPVEPTPAPPQASRMRVRLTVTDPAQKRSESAKHGDIESFAGCSTSERSRQCAANVSGNETAVAVNSV